MRARLLVLLAGARALLEIQTPERLRGQQLPTGNSQFIGPQRFLINSSLILLEYRDARWIHESDNGHLEGEPRSDSESSVYGGTCAYPAHESSRCHTGMKPGCSERSSARCAAKRAARSRKSHR